MTIENRARLASALPIMSLAIFGCQEGPVDHPAPPSATAECSAEMLRNGRLLSTNLIVRSKGKPEVDQIPFELVEGEGLCLVVKTGTEGPDGQTIAPAPASAVIGIGSTELISPSDLNAHPKLLVKHLSSADLGPGLHSLSVELRGKSGPNPGVAHLALLATHEDEGPNDSAIVISKERLESPNSFATTLKDEAIVIMNEHVAPANFQALLNDLPFSAVAIDSLQSTPVYRVFLPDASGGEDLVERLHAMESIPGVFAVNAHHIGGSVPNRLPQPGTDRDYVDENSGGLHDEAWHLDHINAEQAWDHPQIWHEDDDGVGAIASSVKIGVIDNGFNIEHEGISENIGDCLGPGYCTTDASVLAPRPNSEMPWNCDPETSQDPDLCEKWRECTRQDTNEFSGHGTVVAGLIAAEGETVLPDTLGDTVGVVWKGWNASTSEFAPPLSLSRYDYVVLHDPETGEITSTETNYGTERLVSAMISSGVRVINLSYGLLGVCREVDKLAPIYTIGLEDMYSTPEEKRNSWVKQGRDFWTKTLRDNPGVLVVQAAGNSGGRCDDETFDSSWCSAGYNGHACAIPESQPESKQVLCVGASDSDDKIAFFTNTGGDLLAAPGLGVSGMTYDGPTELWDGTSMSAPIVAGAAALIFSVSDKIGARHAHEILLNSGSILADYDDEMYRILDLDQSLDVAARCLNQGYSEIASTSACPEFPDVPDTHWAYDSVKTLACECVIEGYSDWTYKPEQSINRAEALKILLEMALPGYAFQNPGISSFDDVPADIWYSKYAHYALDNGMLDDLQLGSSFGGAEFVTRAEFMYLLVGAASLSERDHYQHLSDVFVSDSSDPDLIYEDLPLTGSCPAPVIGDSPCHQFHEHIYAATKQCTVEGNPAGKFEPDTDLNRAEAAKIACVAAYGHGSPKCGEFAECTPRLPL